MEEQGNKFFGRPCIFKQQKAEKKLGGASTVEGYCTVQFKLRHNWNLVIHGYPEEYKAIVSVLISYTFDNCEEQYLFVFPLN